MSDTEKEALCARIDELCAENERLRLRHKGYVVDLQEALAENVKLRELVDGITWCAEPGSTCGNECPLYDDKSEPDHCRERRLKRELRIEVSDG